MKNSKGVNNINNNNHNCKTKIDCPMNVMCNFRNVVYQAIIFPKENVKDKKLILKFRRLDGNCNIIIIFIRSLLGTLEKSNRFIQTFLEVEKYGLNP